MIVFRGERVDGGGGIVEGHHVRSGNRHYILDDPAIDHHPGCDFRDCRGCIMCEPIEVHPESLTMGDTNLKDKNGTTIFGSFEYEDGKMSRGGDILQFMTSRIGEGKNTMHKLVSIFENGEFSIERTNECTGSLSAWLINWPAFIIGNAYSSPELLEESK